MKLIDVANRLRAIADGMRRIPNRDAQEHALEINRIAADLLRSNEARREEMRGTFQSAVSERRRSSEFHAFARDHIADL